MAYGLFSDITAALEAEAGAESHRGAGGLCRDAAEEITKLRERCAGYKGQVESGAIVIERLRAALRECGAPFDTGPTTVAGAAQIIGAEFERRLNIAATALEQTEDGKR